MRVTMANTAKCNHIKLMIHIVTSMMVVVYRLVTAVRTKEFRRFWQFTILDSFMDILMSCPGTRVIFVPLGGSWIRRTLSFVISLVLSSLRLQFEFLGRVAAVLALVGTKALFAPVMVSIFSTGAFREVQKGLDCKAFVTSLLSLQGRGQCGCLPMVVSIDVPSGLAFYLSKLFVCSTRNWRAIPASALTFAIGLQQSVFCHPRSIFGYVDREVWSMIKGHRKLTFLMSNPATC